MQVTSPDALVLMNMTEHERESAQAYSDIGINLLRSFDMQRFTLGAVQAYLLRSSWLKNLGRGVESWHCLGVAIRSVRMVTPLLADLTVYIDMHRSLGCTREEKFINILQTGQAKHSVYSGMRNTKDVFGRPSLSLMGKTSLSDFIC